MAAKQKFYLVLAIDGGARPKFPDRITRVWMPCRLSLFKEPQAAWAPKAAELARKHGFELGDRFSRWPDGFDLRACVYQGVVHPHASPAFAAKGTPTRCSSPFYFPARRIS